MRHSSCFGGGRAGGGKGEVVCEHRWTARMNVSMSPFVVGPIFYGVCLWSTLL